MSNTPQLEKKTQQNTQNTIEIKKIHKGNRIKHKGSFYGEAKTQHKSCKSGKGSRLKEAEDSSMLSGRKRCMWCVF